eukprot:Opistho-2@48094
MDDLTGMNDDFVAPPLGGLPPEGVPTTLGLGTTEELSAVDAVAGAVTAMTGGVTAITGGTTGAMTGGRTTVVTGVTGAATTEGTGAGLERVLGMMVGISVADV